MKDYEKKNEGSNLIDRQKAIDMVRAYAVNWSQLIDEIEDIPPAQTDRQQGEWIYPYESTKTICVCSICGHGTGTGLNPYNYCPHCGADMRGSKNHE